MTEDEKKYWDAVPNECMSDEEEQSGNVKVFKVLHLRWRSDELQEAVRTLDERRKRSGHGYSSFERIDDGYFTERQPSRRCPRKYIKEDEN